MTWRCRSKIWDEGRCPKPAYCGIDVESRFNAEVAKFSARLFLEPLSQRLHFRVGVNWWTGQLKGFPVELIAIHHLTPFRAKTDVECSTAADMAACICTFLAQPRTGYVQVLTCSDDSELLAIFRGYSKARFREGYVLG